MRRLAPLLVLLAACTDPASPTDGGVDAAVAPPSDAGPPPPPPPSTRVTEPLIEHVDPFLGTGGSGYNDLGNAYPGPTRPYGMARPGPDTQEEGGAPGACRKYEAGCGVKGRASRGVAASVNGDSLNPPRGL
jgi:hypothetical protein